MVLKTLRPSPFAKSHWGDLARGSATRRFVENDHITRPAARAAHAAFQPRERKGAPPRPDQRLHVELLAVIAFAARLRARSLRAAVGATHGNAPTLRTGFAERFDRHRRPRTLLFALALV